MEKAKQGYLQARQVGRTTDQALVGMLGNLRQLNRTMAHDAELDKKIENLKVEDIAAALRKHIDPKKLTVVVAGDFNAPAPAAPVGGATTGSAQ